MSDREAFEKWASGIGLGDNLVFDTSAGYVGVKYMAYQAWQAAQAHERTQIVKPGEEGWQLREVYFDVIDGELQSTAYRAPQAAQAQAGEGETPAAWQFYQNGEWHMGMPGIYRAKTIAAGFETRDLYTRPQPAQVNQQLPEGYVLVPLDPSEAMIDAGVAVAFAASVHGKGGWNNYMKALYRAFIAAAQEGK